MKIDDTLTLRTYIFGTCKWIYHNYIWRRDTNFDLKYPNQYWIKKHQIAIIKNHFEKRYLLLFTSYKYSKYPVRKCSHNRMNMSVYLKISTITPHTKKRHWLVKRTMTIQWYHDSLCSSSMIDPIVHKSYFFRVHWHRVREWQDLFWRCRFIDSRSVR